MLVPNRLTCVHLDIEVYILLNPRHNLRHHSRRMPSLHSNEDELAVRLESESHEYWPD